MKTSKVNVLIYRDLPANALAALEREFPGVNFQVVRPPHLVDEDIAWPEVVCGNVPATWAAEAPQNQPWWSLQLKAFTRRSSRNTF